MAILAVYLWFPSQVAETVASSCASASCYHSTKNIGVVSVVIFELTFRNVQRHVFAAHLMIAANNRPLEDRPEAFNRLSVNRADNVFMGAVHDGLVRVFAERLVATVFIGRQQTYLCRNCLAHETPQVTSRPCAENAGYYISLALDCADDNRLVEIFAAAFRALAAMPITALAADESLVHLDDTHKLLELFVLKRRADAMANIPSGFVRTEAHEALHLHGADTLLGGQHQVDDLEPVAQINLRVFENCADKMREAVSAAFAASRTFPFEFHGLERVNAIRATARASDLLWPAARDQVVVASFLIRKELVEVP